MNLLQNPAFDDPAERLPSSLGHPPLTRPTIAPHWVTHRYSESAVITTDLLPNTFPPALGDAGANMIHVCTTDLAELMQIFPSEGHSTMHFKTGAWVFVLRGTVSVAIGPDPELVCAATKSTRLAEWEYLEGRNGVYPVGCLAIGSAVETVDPGAGETTDRGACFYISSASVQPISEDEWRRIPSERRGLTDVSQLTNS